MADKEEIAILRLQEAAKMSMHATGKALVITTSGGKDSSVCVALAQRAGIDFEVLHNHWDYIQAEQIPVNPLYECGFSRVGCVGCPMAGKAGRQMEFSRWPAYKRLYIRAFDRMLSGRRLRGLPTDWQTGEEVYHWWMEDGVLPGQMALWEEEE